jgi:hypothetical protein
MVEIHLPIDYIRRVAAPLRNCIAFLPDRAIAAHPDFVCGFCSGPSNLVPLEGEISLSQAAFGVRRTGKLSVPCTMALVFSMRAGRQTSMSACAKESCNAHSVRSEL